jgi:FMN-dependent oxidoreductase (nitrilotriacetate monooxygenase family)
MPESRTIHLAADLSFAHTDQRWSLPGSWQGFRYYGTEFYSELARIAARGRFDMLFFGDAAETPENYGGSYDEAIRRGFRWPKHDMSTMIPVMAQAAEGVGFGLTINTTYQHPFHVARLMSSLDWVTGGRVGWNSVTGAYKNEAANWGFDGLPDPAERYRRAHEHMEVVTGLWDTVEPDAIILDRENGVFGDPSKVHLLEHRGEHFSVRGPLPAMPSPQGRPVIIQAGQSADGLALAARYADMQFAARKTTATMAEHRRKLDELLIAEGRSPRELGCWWAINVIVADSRAEALAKKERLLKLLGPEHGFMMLSALYGVDFSVIDPTWKVTEVADRVRESKAHWGTFEEVLKTADPDMSVGDWAIDRIISQPAFIGSPTEIVDQMEEFHEAGDQNGGFILSSGYFMPQFLIDFVDQVVPELQRRGLSKREYAGPTLRENLFA